MKKETKAQRIFNSTFFECWRLFKRLEMKVSDDPVGFTGLCTEESTCKRTFNAIQKIIDSEKRYLINDLKLEVYTVEEYNEKMFILDMVQTTLNNSIKADFDFWHNDTIESKTDDQKTNESKPETKEDEKEGKKTMKKISKVNVQKAIEKRREFLEIALKMDNLKLHFSFGNSKMGKIPSFSVLPFLTCTNCKECGKYCYAAKNCFNFNHNIQNLAENTANIRNIPMNELIEQFDEILGGNVMYKYFRFNVAGDIAGMIGTKYFDLILNVTKKYPFTTFLIFTKNYDLINTYIANGGKLPENLSVVFSQWDNIKIDNPYNLPVAIVKINENTEIPENAFHCSGDCSSCLDCWKAEKGSTRYFDLH